MSVNAYPAVQINTVDLSTMPNNNIMAQIGGVGLSCPNGVVLQDLTLVANSTNIALAFPNGAATAVFIYISSVTTTDLIVKVGTGSPVSLSVPACMGTVLYSLASNAVSLNSVKGGKVQYAIGG